jgi:putative flavoprotein involved in K+ transport
MNTTVVVIGGGQAGLAMSRCLTGRSIDHVVLERGEVANSWRTERWDSLRLLTPNWLSRLPGHRYRGDDPNGYMCAAEVVAYLEAYRRSFDPPVQTGTTVTGVATTPSGFRVTTNRGRWRCRSVVVATGGASDPRLPALSQELPPSVDQIHALRYRNPELLDPGPVLVVGASASGAQIADELARRGREVTLAVGEHVRLPRTYRGRDIHWWMDAIGLLDERHDEVDDIARARRLPSLQLIGSPERRTLDLNALAAAGVELTGRLVGVTRGRFQFSGSLANVAVSADLKQNRLLDRIDDHAAAAGLGDELPEPERPARTVIPAPPLELDMSRFATVIWATGYRPRYGWLDSSLLDRRGQLRHHGGVVDIPGMYVLGLPFTRRRKSNFLDGVGPDARDLCAHLLHYLDQRQVAA